MSLGLKPTHATVKAYDETLHELGQLYIDHEGAVRSALPLQILLYLYKFVPGPIKLLL
jgi:hypothetical protein